MSRKKNQNRPQSRVELTSDGTWNGTHVYLVVSDGQQEQRFEIPNVATAELNVGHRPGAGEREPILILGLGKPYVEVHVGIGHGRSSVEDLLAEVAAAKLRSSDR